MSDAISPAPELPTNVYQLEKYVRIVLPLDGFVFWVRAASLTESALLGAMLMNGAPYNAARRVADYPKTLNVRGSIHFATELSQDETETYATNTIRFTAEEKVLSLNDVAPEVLYMLRHHGARYFFGSTDNFFDRAGIWHYNGHAVYADMASQVIDDVRSLSQRAIVSNSLPIWLSFNDYKPYEWEPFSNPVQLFPSFLVPQNLAPPYAVVHVIPETTVSLSSGPSYGRNWSNTQLTKETVRITTYGLDNDASQDLCDFVLMWTSNNPSVMGVMNSPVFRDEKRGQVELGTIAQKKSIDFEVNYYQTRARDIARQLIQNVVYDFFIEGVHG